jgi:hypothetical protein
MRNRTEYEGALDVNERLVADLITSCRKVAEKVESWSCQEERSPEQASDASCVQRRPPQ